jgi:hypothetical protein
LSSGKNAVYEELTAARQSSRSDLHSDAIGSFIDSTINVSPRSNSDPSLLKNGWDKSTGVRQPQPSFGKILFAIRISMYCW